MPSFVLLNQNTTHKRKKIEQNTEVMRETKNNYFRA